MTVALLSNPTLDELYSIRRTFSGQLGVYLTMPNRGYEVEHYTRKVNAMDEAINAFIKTFDVPKEHTEQFLTTPEEAVLLARAREITGAKVRVPGDTP